MKYKFIVYLLLMLQLSFSQKIYSHPHVFFETNFEVKIENKILEGMEVCLILDKLNTKLNKRILKPDEEKNVESENIVFLEELYKHVRVSFDGENVSKNDIIFEQAKLDEGQLEIYLFVSINKEIKENSKLNIAFYDKKYYYSYDYNLMSLKIDKFSENFDKKKNIKFFTNKKISFYFNLIHPEEYEVQF